MIRTFGLGPLAKKCLFLAFGIGPPAKIVGKSQGKRKNNASGNMANFGPFWSPWVAIPCQRWRPCFDIFPNVFCVFWISHDLMTMFFSLLYFPYLFISSYFYYKYSTAQHATYTIHNHTHAHTTCTPATDRDLESGLSESNARKNLEKRLKKAKSGESLAKARFDIDGQIILLLGRSGERRIEPSGSWFPPIFPSFSGKTD